MLEARLDKVHLMSTKFKDKVEQWHMKITQLFTV